MEIEVVSADGTTLVARRSGNGVPVVLVHGSSGGLDSWDGVAPYLSEAFEVWVYARRGYAPSGAGADGKTFADDVADLLAVVHAAGGDAHVVGASYGGTVALHTVDVTHAGCGQLAADSFNDGATCDRAASRRPHHAGRSIPFRNPHRTRAIRGETTEVSRLKIPVDTVQAVRTQRLTSESPDSPQHRFGWWKDQ